MKFRDTLLLFAGGFLAFAYFVWSVAAVIMERRIPLGPFYLAVTGVVLLAFVWRLATAMGKQTSTDTEKTA